MTHLDPNAVRAAHRGTLYGLAQQNFYCFYWLMAQVLLPGEAFSDAWHFRALAHKLQQAFPHVSRFSKSCDE